MVWRGSRMGAVIGLLSALFLLSAGLAPAVAQSGGPPLSELARAIAAKDAAKVQAIVTNPANVAAMEAIGGEAIVEFHMSSAAALERAGALANASVQYQLAIAKIQAKSGVDAFALVDPLSQRARVLSALGDHAAAAQHLERAIAIVEKAAGSRHASLPGLYSRLAEARKILGDELGGRAASERAYESQIPPIGAAGSAGPVAEIAAEDAKNAPFEIVDVYYATHRQPTGARDPRAYFGAKQGVLRYGKVKVSVPRNREIGALPRPNVWTFDFRPDPAKHVLMAEIQPLSDRNGFLKDVSGAIGKSKLKEAFVFIHGYNNTFEDAALRTGQIAADLEIDGAAIFYSWPSKADMFAYNDDAKVAESKLVAKDLAAFLNDVATRTGAKRVHLIGHSMGNRAMIAALEEIARQQWAKYSPGQTPKTTRLFDEMVFAAPDVGVDQFRKRVPLVQALGRRSTLYASARDRALQVSAAVNKMRRAGDAREALVLPGLQTVDTSLASGGLIGHDDFAGTALDDFRAIIWQSLEPQRRCLLAPGQKPVSGVWIFAAGKGGCDESEFRAATIVLRRLGSVEAAMIALDNPAAIGLEPAVAKRAKERLAALFGLSKVP